MEYHYIKYVRATVFAAICEKTGRRFAADTGGEEMGTKVKNLIGQKLEKICMDRGWSSYMLSGASGVPLTTVLHIVDGSTKNPGVYTLMKLCKALEYPTGRFLDELEQELDQISSMYL